MPSAKSRLILIYTVVEQSLMVVYQTLFFFLRLILTAFFFVAVFSSKWFTAVLIKCACFQYRSINHRVDAGSLRLYRWYYSRICQWILGTIIAVVLLLAFVERPSSLSISSDPRHQSNRWEPPCGAPESVEMLCLFIFCLDLAVKSYLIGWEEFRKSKWLISYTVVICVSVVDWVLSVSMECDEKLRVRRLVRPFFLLQNSSLMKKTLKCIKRTLPEIASVILLLALHLCLFTMIGMLLFAKNDQKKNGEWELHFKNLTTSLTSLLVLLTTANNPDVMIPAYSLNRCYAIFFITFSIIVIVIAEHYDCPIVLSFRRNLFCPPSFLLNILMLSSAHPTRQASQQFAEQGYMDQQQFRRIFDELDKDCIKEHPPLPQYTSATLQKLQVVFSHYYLTVLGNLVALANVLCICVSSTILVLNSEKSTEERDNNVLEVINLCFILFYLSEMSVKIFAFGWRGYLSYRSNIFDGFLTVLLLILQIAIFITYRLPYSQEPSSRGVMSLWEMVRLVNMLIVFRFLRIIPDIKLMALVASTLLDLVKNLRAFAGILVVSIHRHISDTVCVRSSVFSMDNTTSNFSTACGTYEQLGYWPNNFDDFAAAIILLYDVMIVNNWQAFMEAYSRYTSEWSKVYFVCWWLTSSVMWVNLFVALILENFIYKWDRSHSCSVTDVEKIRYETSVQFMFKYIQEPTEEELACQLHQHPHLHLEWRHEHQNIRPSLPSLRP
uniref:Two pore segment channel 2 n=1 Tax=Xiphophorus maculatus TaxID=8083 RepID=A0A3B5QFX2_XIPMA